MEDDYDNIQYEQNKQPRKRLSKRGCNIMKRAVEIFIIELTQVKLLSLLITSVICFSQAVEQACQTGGPIALLMRPALNQTTTKLIN